MKPLGDMDPKWLKVMAWLAGKRCEVMQQELTEAQEMELQIRKQLRYGRSSGKQTR